jgi:hypothetical protein
MTWAVWSVGLALLEENSIGEVVLKVWNLALAVEPSGSQPADRHLSRCVP